MQYLLIINAFLFLMLTLIWSRANFSNLMVKVGLAGLTIANVLFALQLFGYIIKV